MIQPVYFPFLNVGIIPHKLWYTENIIMIQGHNEGITFVAYIHDKIC